MLRSAQLEVVYVWDTFYPVPGPTAGYPLVSVVAEEQARCMPDEPLAERVRRPTAGVRDPPPGAPGPLHRGGRAMTRPEPMIAAAGVEKIYGSGVVQVRALCGVDLMVSAGEVGSRALATPCSQ